jgi:hypothetical protein
MIAWSRNFDCFFHPLPEQRMRPGLPVGSVSMALVDTHDSRELIPRLCISFPIWKAKAEKQTTLKPPCFASRSSAEDSGSRLAGSLSVSL